MQIGWKRNVCDCENVNACMAKVYQESFTWHTIELLLCKKNEDRHTAAIALMQFNYHRATQRLITIAKSPPMVKIEFGPRISLILWNLFSASSANIPRTRCVKSKLEILGRLSGLKEWYFCQLKTCCTVRSLHIAHPRMSFHASDKNYVYRKTCTIIDKNIQIFRKRARK